MNRICKNGKSVVAHQYAAHRARRNAGILLCSKSRWSPDAAVDWCVCTKECQSWDSRLDYSRRGAYWRWSGACVVGEVPGCEVDGANQPVDLGPDDLHHSIHIRILRLSVLRTIYSLEYPDVPLKNLGTVSPASRHGCIVGMACDGVQGTMNNFAISRSAQQFVKLHACQQEETQLTVIQSSITMPPVSPELAFQSHQYRLGRLAWGKSFAV
jgi:hypothetical protein